MLDSARAYALAVAAYEKRVFTVRRQSLMRANLKVALYRRFAGIIKVDHTLLIALTGYGHSAVGRYIR